jgi:hypothetical protein
MPAACTQNTKECPPKQKSDKVAKRATKRAPARPYKKLYQSVLVDRIATMQKQLHVMACKTELLKHRLTNYERESQQRDEEGYTGDGPCP